MIASSVVHLGFVNATSYPSFVLINDFSGEDILATNLAGVINTLSSSGVTYVIPLCGYWNFINGTAYINGGGLTNTAAQYFHSALFYQNMITQMHNSGLKVLCWISDGATYSSAFGQCNISLTYLPTYEANIKTLMNLGFDGFADDIESWVGWRSFTQHSTFENSLALYLHNGSNFANGQPRISTPFVGTYADIVEGHYLKVDYNMVMFYNNQNDSATTDLWYPEVVGDYNGSYGQGYGPNIYTPLSPVILTLMVPNGLYGFAWTGESILTEIPFYTHLLIVYPHTMLYGYALWCYEDMSYTPSGVNNPNATAYWNAFNTWITTTLPSYNVPPNFGSSARAVFVQQFILIVIVVVILMFLVLVLRRKKKPRKSTCG
jgi:hypothetical protein